MAKAGELDWSNLMKGDVGEPAHPLAKGDVKGANKPVKASKEQLLADAEHILRGFLSKGIRQLTDEEMFGHLVVTDEMVEKAQKEWNDRVNGLQHASNVKVDDKDYSFGTGKMVDWDSLSEEEKIARNMHAKE